jgi:tetratricopeptide (TPR) repeat protein
MQLRIFSVILICSHISLASTGSAAEDSLKTYFWGLIKIYPKPKIQYEPGYWKNKLLHPREFHHPISFMPLELRYGLSYTGGGGDYGENMKSGWIKYDEGVEGHFDAGKKIAKWGHQLDFDFMKLNLSNFMLKTSWLDMQTGLNYRSANLLFPDTIPMSKWGTVNPNWNINRKFSPKISEFSLSHALVFQWFEQFYFNARYTWGLAQTKFYYSTNSDALDETPGGWGPSTSYAFGVRFIFDAEKQYRFAVGLDLKHSYIKIKHVDDPDDITPISGFHLRDYGIYLTLAAFYGGKLTAGDNAKEYYYRGDFIEAKKIFENFIQKNPSHSNLYRAQSYLALCNEKIPYQLFKEGMQFENNSMTDKAVDRYLASLRNADSTLAIEVNAHLYRIASLRLQDAELLMSKGKHDKALAMVQKTALFSDKARKEIPRFEGLQSLANGKTAMKYRFYDKALQLFSNALLKYPPLKREINAYHYQIAAMMVEDINQIRDASEIRLAVIALEEAKNLSGGIGPVNEKIYKVLKNRLDELEQLTIRYGIDKRMEEERLRRAKLKNATIRIGMTIPQVMDIIGEPVEIIQKQSSKGKDSQLWLYPMHNDRNLVLSFLDYKLFKIE